MSSLLSNEVLAKFEVHFSLIFELSFVASLRWRLFDLLFTWTALPGFLRPGSLICNSFNVFVANGSTLYSVSAVSIITAAPQRCGVAWGLLQAAYEGSGLDWEDLVPLYLVLWILVGSHQLFNVLQILQLQRYIFIEYLLQVVVLRKVSDRWLPVQIVFILLVLLQDLISLVQRTSHHAQIVLNICIVHEKPAGYLSCHGDVVVLRLQFWILPFEQLNIVFQILNTFGLLPRLGL